MIFGDRIANLGVIDFKIGLHIKVNVNGAKQMWSSYLSYHLAKLAIDWSSIGKNRPDATYEPEH